MPMVPQLTGFGPYSWTYTYVPEAPKPNTYITIINQAPQAQPVSPVFDPKLEANALYGKPMALCALGYARVGASPAPIIGPYINSQVVDFAVSFGVAVPVTGDRKIYKIFLDNELAWESDTGGTSHLDGTFRTEPFQFLFRPGTLTQLQLGLEDTHFPGDQNAYRPEMVLELRGLPIQRFMDNTGKPVPYVACEIGDVTDGADPFEGINLGTALERIAHSPWAGYTSDTFEAVGITDVVPAVLIKDNFTVVDLCRSVTRIYRNLDLLQSNKLYIKDRGNVDPDFEFDRDSIIGGSNPIQIIRAGATEQRREIELHAIDPDQDYMAVPSLSKIPRSPFTISAAVGKEAISTPLVMTADIRQALVTYAQQYEENARRKISYRVGVSGYQVEPGDLVADVDIADGIDNEVWKVTQTEHLADFTVAIEAEAILRCRVFSSAQGDPGIVYQFALADADPGWHSQTVAHVIDNANLSPAFGEYCRIKIRFSALSIGATMTGMYFGQQAPSGDDFDFSGTQTQVLFGGIDTITGDSLTLEFVSDVFQLGEPYDHTKNYVCAAQFGAVGSVGLGRTLSAAPGNRTVFKAAADAATTDKSGYSFHLSNTAHLVAQIEILASP